MKRKKTTKRALAMLLSILMMSGTLASCAKNEEQDPPSASSGGSTASGGGTTAVTYPIDTDEKLTYWKAWDSQYENDYNKTTIAKLISEKTGVTVEYESPADPETAFSIMLSSGDMPDIVEYAWANFPGGLDTAITDEYIIPLNNLMSQNAPNLAALYEEHPDLVMDAQSSDGSFYCFPHYKLNDSQLTYAGTAVRQDWLDELDMEVPTTIEEWELMLVAFKEKMGAKIPLSLRDSGSEAFRVGMFTGAFGIKADYYHEDGVVKFGPTQDAYKDFLLLMNDWFNKGLLDPNFVATDNTLLTTKMVNGEAGAGFGYAGSSMGQWLTAASANPDFDVVGVPYPTLEKGETPKFGHKLTVKGGNDGPAISVDCENPELAMQFLDYNYSQEGLMVTNYGTEGRSYEMVDGVPTFTDLILKNPDGISAGDMLFMEVHLRANGHGVQAPELVTATYPYPMQSKACETWSKTDEDEHYIKLYGLTPELTTELAGLKTDIKTYVEEMTSKFIMGLEPIDKFDSFVETINGMDVARAIEIQQDALGK